MIRGLLLAVLLFAIALAIPAALGSDQRAYFDHTEHDKALRRQGISCVGCHQVGAKAEGAWVRGVLADTFLTPPEGACHQCHAPGEGDLGAGAGMPAAPRTCGTCHEEVAAPETHWSGWLVGHGREAAFDAASCRDCHTRSSCVECHDRRETVARSVHDASWLGVHGIAARAGPAGCDTCHAQAECTSCHGSAAGFGRTP